MRTMEVMRSAREDCSALWVYPMYLYHHLHTSPLATRIISPEHTQHAGSDPDVTKDGQSAKSPLSQAACPHNRRSNCGAGIVQEVLANDQDVKRRWKPCRAIGGVAWSRRNACLG